MNYVRLVAVELLVGLFVGSRKFLAKKKTLKLAMLIGEKWSSSRRNSEKH